MKNLILVTIILLTLNPLLAFAGPTSPQASLIEVGLIASKSIVDLKVHLTQHIHYNHEPVISLVAVLKARNNSVVFGGYAKSLFGHHLLKSTSCEPISSAFVSLQWSEYMEEELCEMEFCYSLQEIL